MNSPFKSMREIMADAIRDSAKLLPKWEGVVFGAMMESTKDWDDLGYHAYHAFSTVYQDKGWSGEYLFDNFKRTREAEINHKTIALLLLANIIESEDI